MRPDDPKLALLRARNAYNRMVERNIQSLRESARFQAQTGSPVRGYLTDLGTTVLDLAGSVPSGVLSVGALGEYAARQYGRGVTGQELLPPSAYGMGGDVMLEGGIEAAAAMAPMAGPALRGAGRAGVELIDVLNARAAQMAIKNVSERAAYSGAKFFDDSIEAAVRDTRELMPGARNAEDIPIPRPNRQSLSPTGAPNAISTRVDWVNENADRIASRMAEDLEPLVGTSAQYFYHLGPVKRKLLDMGYDAAEVDDFLDEFAKAYAAFSPRTETTQNLRNAFLAMAKRRQGFDVRGVMGPGSGGVSEKGYPMMDFQIDHFNQIMEEGWNAMANPKPATFNQNILGNHSLATVDVHATKAPLLIANELDPGSLPPEWIKPIYRNAYRENPASLTHSMLAEGMNSKELRDEAGNIVADRAVMEYESLSRIYDNIAKKLDISPAEAQALAWFNYGQRTGLKSQPGSLVDLLNQQIDITAQVMEIRPEDVVHGLMRREIPLLTLTGGAMMNLGDEETEQEYY
jgi:DivIVA domain-containing protein